LFGIVGSAIVIALVGPALLRIDLVAACKEYEEKQGGKKEVGGAGTAWHRWEMRAFRVPPGARVIGLRAIEAEAMVPNARVFVQRLRRDGVINARIGDRKSTRLNSSHVASSYDVFCLETKKKK